MNPGLSAPLKERTWLGVKTALDLLGETKDVFNPSTRWDGVWQTEGWIGGCRVTEAGREASLVYKASSRSARATQRHPISKNPKQTNKTKTKLPQTLISCLFYCYFGFNVLDC